jgi:hypothetical protein
MVFKHRTSGAEFADMRSLLFQAPAFLILAMVGSGCGKAEPEQEKKDLDRKELVVAPKPYTVRMDSGTVTVMPGGKARMKFTIARQNYDGPLTVEAQGLPAGVTATPTKLASKQTSGAMEIAASKTAAAGDKSNVTVTASSPDASLPKIASPAFKISVMQPFFTLKAEPEDFHIRKGTTAKVIVTAIRQGYDGPITLKLDNLPIHVKAPEVVLGENKLTAEILVHADGKALEKRRASVKVQGSAEKIQPASTEVVLSILPAPFALETSPKQIKLVYGEPAKITVTATRSGYDGAIALDLANLPAKVKHKKVILLKGQSSVDIDLLVDSGAPSAANVPVRVVGGAAGIDPVVAHVTMTVEGKPFDLRVSPPLLELAQGGKGTLTILAGGKGFTESIRIDMLNLPKHVKAQSVTIAKGKKEAVIEIVAAPEASLGVHPAVKAQGTFGGVVERKITSADFTIKILEPFSLQVQPEMVAITEGGKATFKVNVVRRTYDGPIALELLNLPAKVAAGKATIAAGQKETEIELTAPAKIADGAIAKVQIVGTAETKQMVNANFTVNLAQKLFELKIQPGPLKVTFGDKATVKVVVNRAKTYQGPIDLELRNLPAYVSAGKATLSAGKTEAEIEITAAGDAKAGTVKFQVQGTATKAGNQVLVSGDFPMTLVPGFFDLRTDPVFPLSFDANTKLKVTALRKGYKGPIEVELRFLPKDVTASKATIPAGKDQVEIDIKADAKASEGDRVDVCVRGTAQDKQVYSPCFTLSVGSVGQPPALELKVEPALLKVFHNDSGKVKVTAVRKGYMGPIKVELRNLPEDVEAEPVMIPIGKTSAELTLLVRSNASIGSRPDVCVVGIAIAADNRPYASPHFTLTVIKR